MSAISTMLGTFTHAAVIGEGNSSKGGGRLVVNPEDAGPVSAGSSDLAAGDPLAAIPLENGGLNPELRTRREQAVAATAPVLRSRRALSAQAWATGPAVAPRAHAVDPDCVELERNRLPPRLHAERLYDLVALYLAEALEHGDLGALRPLRLLRDRADLLLQEHARQAHYADGQQWPVIAEQLGVTPQAMSARDRRNRRARSAAE